MCSKPEIRRGGKLNDSPIVTIEKINEGGNKHGPATGF